MPFLFKQTLIVDGLGHGYSESLYFEMPTRSFIDAAVNVVDIVNKRRPLLGKQHALIGARLALVQDDAGAKVTRQTIVQKFFLAGTQAQQSAESNVSLQCLFTSGAANLKKLSFLSGPWRDIFPFGNALDQSVGSFTTFFNQWVAAVKTAKLGWLHQVLDQERPVTNYVFDPLTGHTTFTFGGGGFGWTINGRPRPITIEFPTTKSPLDGTYLVIPINATSAKTAKARPASPFVIDGLARTYNKTFVTVGSPDANTPAGSIVAQNPMTRERGRPLLVSRGRLPNRVLW